MTDRLPFDPDRMRARARPAPGGSPAPGSGPGAEAGAEARLTVTQLAELIDGALRTGVPRPVVVVGEVTNFKNRSHWYFDLKDGASVVSCVMFAPAAAKAGFEPADGQEVLVRGRVEFYARGGKTQVYAERMQPVGAGALELAFRRLCEELRARGYFDPERKRRLPAFPGRVAVVTSRTGAALQDVLDTMRRRCPAVDVVLLDVRVQGERAAPEIARALDWIGRERARLGVEAVVLTRGGGSMEDLWAFNERAVADAILRCPVPVVAAIGHETDTTIAELVADERCATPTQAAMRVTPDRGALEEQAALLSKRLRAAVRVSADRARQRLGSAARHAFFAQPRRGVDGARGRLAEVARRLAMTVRERAGVAARRVERAGGRLELQRPAAVYARRDAALRQAEAALRGAMRSRLAGVAVSAAAERLARAWRVGATREAAQVESLERQLLLVGPASVLARGYSCTMTADGNCLRSVAAVRAGDRLRTVLADGVVDSTADAVAAGDGLGLRASERPPPAPSRARGRRRRTPPEEPPMDLFTRGG